ncbi:MAG: chemotaxis protein CheX [Balneolaceae bacterium]
MIKLMNSEALRDQIYAIALHTFEIVCFMYPLGEQEADENGLDEPDERVRSLVRFTGAREGAMIVTPSRQLRQSIASNMLGIEQADEEQEMGALKEISNILCGNAAPLLARNGTICSLKPPEIPNTEKDPASEIDDNVTETIRIPFDEGWVEITVVFTK